MIIVEDVSGNQEPLLVNDVHVTQQLSAVEQLDFTTMNIPENSVAYSMLQPRTKLILPETGEIYRLTQNDGQAAGSYYQRTLTGLQVLQDLDDHLVTGKLTGKQSLYAAMQLITSGTAFTFTIHDSIPDFTFTDDFGGDHALSMFVDTLVTDYGFEFTAHGYHIDIYKSIGQQNAFVYQTNADIYQLADTQDYTQIRTHIIGEGKTDDNGNPTIKAEYTSPNASVYGVVDDDLYTDDTATTQAALLAGMKKKLVDYPAIQYTANVNKFEATNDGNKNNNGSLGNYGYLRDRSGIDVNTRVIQRDIYPQDHDNEDTLTFGNFILDPNKMLAELRSNRSKDASELAGIKSNIDAADAGDDDTELAAWTSEEVTEFGTNLERH